MDTFIGRSQKGFSKFSYAVCTAAVVVAIISFIQLHLNGAFDISGSVNNIQPRMQWRDSRRYGGSLAAPKENAIFRFDLDVDLTPLFNWNTKQVFVYITADYNSTSPKTAAVNENSVVIWDRIIPSADKAKLSLERAASKYTVWDIQRFFGGNDREVTLNFHWNVQPRAGFLLYGTVGLENNLVKLPEVSKR